MGGGGVRESVGGEGVRREVCDVAAAGCVREKGEEGVGDDVGDAEGVKRYLELEFSLPPSCYATVLLRELMKTEL